METVLADLRRMGDLALDSLAGAMQDLVQGKEDIFTTFDREDRACVALCTVFAILMACLLVRRMRAASREQAAACRRGNGPRRERRWSSHLAPVGAGG